MKALEKRESNKKGDFGLYEGRFLMGLSFKARFLLFFGFKIILYVLGINKFQSDALLKLVGNLY